MTQRRSRILGCVLAIASALMITQFASAAEDEPLFNRSMVQDPAEGETQGEGETRVFHEGRGEPPAQGYFKKHEPGEIAEFHLFVPDNLDPKRRYPLLIVYHGGKDGASGKGTLRGKVKVSTKEHPVIVLSPNMYTMDAYDELIANGDVPIDPQRVVVFGFSSGGMGVLSAMQAFVRSEGKFTPAALISASTTASMGRAKYPQVPYIVMAGEKETPEFVKNKILKTRRRTCRQHAVMMQQVIREVRYLEMEGFGHTSGKPAHVAAIRNVIRSLPEPDVKLKVPKIPDDLEPLVEAARAANWIAVKSELTRLDETPAMAKKISYRTLRGRVLKALESSFKADVKFIAGIDRRSRTWEILRAFQVYDRIEAVPALFAEMPSGVKLGKQFDSLAKAKRWQSELEARRQYYEIVSQPPSAEMIESLEALREASPDTEFGANRTREKLLALRG